MWSYNIVVYAIMEAMDDMTGESLIVDLDIRDEVLEDKDRQINTRFF